MEVTLEHSLKESQIHLLGDRRPLVSQKIIIIWKIRTKHRQFASLSQQFPCQCASVEFPSGKHANHVTALQMQGRNIKILRRQINLHQHVMVNHKLKLLLIVPSNAKSFKHRLIPKIHRFGSCLLQRLKAYQMRIPSMIFGSQSLATIQANTALFLIATAQLTTPSAIAQLGSAALSIKGSIRFMAHNGPNTAEHRAKIRR